ncbi:MAG: beta strand repeat-containing protein [Paracoccaceae bacterium]
MPTITLNDSNNTFIDTVTGGDQTVDTIFAGAGHDSIFASFGDDIIYGGTGNDTISSNSAGFFTGDVVYGGEGDDVITTELYSGGTSSAADTVFGGAGNDSITGSTGGPIAGTDKIFAGTGNDVVDGNGGGDEIDLGSGNDLLIAREDEDTIDGGAGVDTIDFSQDYESVFIDLNSGAATLVNQNDETETEVIQNFEIVIGTDGDDTILGTAGGNTLIALEGDDTLDGREGADILRPGTGANVIFGGEGGLDFDTLDLRSLPLGITITFTGTERGIVSGGDGGQDTFEQIEMLQLTDNPDFVDARLDGIGVEVHLFDGNDVVQPGAGFDSFFGGDGIDRLNFIGSSQAVNVDNDSGVGTGGNANGDVYDSFEDFVLTNFDDSFFGSNDDETIAGANGEDSISGGEGDDTLLGDQGNDTLDGGAGTNSLNGGSGIDTISFASLQAPSLVLGETEVGAIVDLSIRGAQFTGLSTDTIFDIENADGSAFADFLVGDNDVNVLSGADGGDVLNGSGGNDVLYGGEGFDALEGGIGDDLLFGGTGGSSVEGDLATYFAASGPLTFNFGTSISEILSGSSADVLGDTIGADIEGVAGASNHSNTFNASEIVGAQTFFLGGSESDTFFGSSNTDQLIGLAGDDVLYGNDGSDGLIGEGGDDDLYGGAGTDFFFFDGVDGNDTIHDLELAADFIFFSGGLVSSKGQMTFSATTAGGTAAEDTLITYSANGQDSSITLIDVDAVTAANDVQIFL